LNINLLHNHAKRGWIWTGIEQFVQRGLTVVVTLILARLIGPESFGLVASVSIFFGIAGFLINGGIEQQILQKPKIDDKDYTAFFWANGAISALCASILILSSGLIADFYHNQEIGKIVTGLAINIFLMNIARAWEVRLIRTFRYGLLSSIQISSVVVGCLLGVWMAFSGYGVWALIGQQTGIAITKAILCWILVPWTPKGIPSLSRIKDLYIYGLPIMFSNILGTIADQLINILIAKCVSIKTLGYYDRGRVIPQNIGYSLSLILSRTNFPILAKLQDNPEKLKNTYLKFLRTSCAISFMILAGVGFAAGDIILILLGKQWIPAIWFLRANCVTFSTFIFFKSNIELLRSLGKSKIYFKYITIIALLKITGVIIGMHWGVKGMVVGDIFARTVVCIPLIFEVRKLSNISPWSQLAALVRPTLYSMAVAVSILLISYLGMPIWPRFILSGIAGGLCILLSLFIEKKYFLIVY